MFFLSDESNLLFDSFSKGKSAKTIQYLIKFISFSFSKL